MRIITQFHASLVYPNASNVSSKERLDEWQEATGGTAQSREARAMLCLVGSEIVSRLYSGQDFLCYVPPPPSLAISWFFCLQHSVYRTFSSDKIGKQRTTLVAGSRFWRFRSNYFFSSRSPPPSPLFSFVATATPRHPRSVSGGDLGRQNMRD